MIVAFYWTVLSTTVFAILKFVVPIASTRINVLPIQLDNDSILKLIKLFVRPPPLRVFNRDSGPVNYAKFYFIFSVT